MRTYLEEFLDKTVQFSAVVSRTCVCKREDYALLMNIRDQYGKIVTDHAWVKLTNELNRKPLGSEIEFVARVGKYQKACGDIDYNLEDLRLLY